MEMHQVVLRKRLTLELPHVEKIQFSVERELTIIIIIIVEGHLESKKTMAPIYYICYIYYYYMY